MDKKYRKDKIKAAHYFLESANLGYAPAMMNYGYMCASGDGIRKNLDDGLFWLFYQLLKMEKMEPWSI